MDVVTDLACTSEAGRQQYREAQQLVAILAACLAVIFYYNIVLLVGLGGSSWIDRRTRRGHINYSDCSVWAFCKGLPPVFRPKCETYLLCC